MFRRGLRAAHDEEVSDLDDLDEIAQAHAAIDAARQRYYDLLRAKVKARKVRQSDVARRLGVTREKIRRDVMTQEERDQLRRADADRRRRERGTRPADD